LPPVLARVPDQASPADDDPALRVDPGPVLPALAVGRDRLALDGRHGARVPLLPADDAHALPAPEPGEPLPGVMGGGLERGDAVPGGPAVELRGEERAVDGPAQSRRDLPVISRTPPAAVDRHTFCPAIDLLADALMARPPLMVHDECGGHPQAYRL